MTGSGEIERDEIEALLPWYATGRLAPAERKRVEAYLALHSETAKGLALVREEAEAAIAASEAVSPPDPAALERLMAGIASAPNQRATGAKSGVLDRLAEWLSSLAPHQLAYTAAGLIALLMLQAVTLGTVLMTRDTIYQAANDPDGGAGKASSSALLIGFAPEATMAEVSQFLNENGLTVIDGPRAGLFRVRVTSAEADAAQLQDKLKASPIVTSVIPGH